MARFKIKYLRGNSQRLNSWTSREVESEGEAVEDFEIWAEGFDDMSEIIEVYELDCDGVPL